MLLVKRDGEEVKHVTLATGDEKYMRIDPDARTAILLGLYCFLLSC